MDTGSPVKQDTIFALSSGAGVAAVAVVRVSGPGAADALHRLTQRKPPPARKLVLRWLREPETGKIIDQALVAWLPGPATFTGEDMAELQVHGSRAVVNRLLQALSRLDGARAAEPGEFTRRALLHGRLDLVQVEGLSDLLQAETRAQHRLALAKLTGRSSQQVAAWRRELVELSALVEAAIDFVDEEDVADQALAGMPERLDSLIHGMQATLEMAHPAERVREGVRVVIAGAPNVGKSSLLNWLAGREVAIVSNTPGTTRDVLEVRLDMDGIPVTVFDTAGLRRHTADEIERMGMERAREALVGADIVIWMDAPDAGGEPADEAPLTNVDSPLIRVLNKVDVFDSHQQRDMDIRKYDLAISVKRERGLDELLGRLRTLVRERFGRAESALFSRARQRQKIAAALECLQKLQEQPQLPLELQAELVRSARHHLDELIGRVDVEELLDYIFAEFCIGK